jgi:hypothetical protein
MGYVLQVLDLITKPHTVVASIAVDTDHLWFVPVILGVRPLLSVRVTRVRAEPDAPDAGELRGRIETLVEQLRQALPSPIIEEVAGGPGDELARAMARQRGQEILAYLPGAEMSDVSHGVWIGWPGETEPVVFLRFEQLTAGGVH